MNDHVRAGNEYMSNTNMKNGNLAWPSSNMMDVYAKNANYIPRVEW